MLGYCLKCMSIKKKLKKFKIQKKQRKAIV